MVMEAMKQMYVIMMFMYLMGTMKKMYVIVMFMSLICGRVKTSRWQLYAVVPMKKINSMMILCQVQGLPKRGEYESYKSNVEAIVIDDVKTWGEGKQMQLYSVKPNLAMEAIVIDDVKTCGEGKQMQLYSVKPNLAMEATDIRVKEAGAPTNTVNKEFNTDVELKQHNGAPLDISNMEKPYYREEVMEFNVPYYREEVMEFNVPYYREEVMEFNEKFKKMMKYVDVRMVKFERDVRGILTRSQDEEDQEDDSTNNKLKEDVMVPVVQDTGGIPASSQSKEGQKRCSNGKDDNNVNMYGEDCNIVNLKIFYNGRKITFMFDLDDDYDDQNVMLEDDPGPGVLVEYDPSPGVLVEDDPGGGVLVEDLLPDVDLLKEEPHGVCDVEVLFGALGVRDGVPDLFNDPIPIPVPVVAVRDGGDVPGSGEEEDHAKDEEDDNDGIMNDLIYGHPLKILC